MRWQPFYVLRPRIHKVANLFARFPMAFKNAKLHGFATRSTTLADGAVLYQIHTMQKDKYRDCFSRLPEDMKGRRREARAERTRARPALNLISPIVLTF